MFTEGQLSIRSPKARNQINMLKMSQMMQADRLAMPRQRSVERMTDIIERESKSFLRSSQNFQTYDSMMNGKQQQHAAMRQSSTMMRSPGLNQMMGAAAGHMRSQSNSVLQPNSASNYQ